MSINSDGSAGRALQDKDEDLRESVEQVMKEVEDSTQRRIVAAIIDQTGEYRTISTLSEATELNKKYLRRSLGDLEDRGLVYKRPGIDPSNNGNEMFYGVMVDGEMFDDPYQELRENDLRDLDL